MKPYSPEWENSLVTNPTVFGRRRATPPVIPRGDVLGTYETYAEAQGVVDTLSKAEFDVSKLAIVGHDLTSVERVTGKLSYGRAALSGAASGAWFGLFIGLIMMLFSESADYGLFFASILIGAGFGMLFGIATYAIGRRGRDFLSTSQVIAGSYQIIVDPALAAKAQELLAKS